MTSSAYTDVLTGRTVPLTPAPITLEVWQAILPPDVLDLTHPDSPLQCYHKAHGYHFAWGPRARAPAAPRLRGPRGLLLWEVILTEAQRQYHARGGNLEELAHMALMFLDTSIPQDALAWLRCDDGDPPAALASLVATTPLPAVRQ